MLTLLQQIIAAEMSMPTVHKQKDLANITLDHEFFPIPLVRYNSLQQIVLRCLCIMLTNQYFVSQLLNIIQISLSILHSKINF